MMTKQLGQWLPGSLSHWVLSAAAISGVACTNQLKDYTQITLQASPLASSLETEAQVSAESLGKTQTILESRLVGLGVDLAEVSIQPPDQLVVKLPQSVNAKAAESVLTNTGQLYLRNQKPETEKELAKNIEDLQRLLVEQNTLAQIGKQTEADALQVKIDETRVAISALFEPSTLTGDMLYDAQAQPSSANNNTWDVVIQFNAEGADKFAEQTQMMAGTGRAVGLFLDDVLLSTPVVDVAYAKTGITEGTALISGNFTQDAAKELEVQLKNGALPVQLEAIEVTSSESLAEPNSE